MDRDIVPGSSDDIDTTSEGELSQEYLPSTGQLKVNCKVIPNSRHFIY